MRWLALLVLLVAGSAQTNVPVPQIVDTPTVKVLKGLTAPEFEAEMQQINVALGVSCGFCHVRGNFASDENPHKMTARKMLEMTGKINEQFFPGTKRVTCYTCHQGEQKPKQPDPF
ncbi:MAG TPA: c-type cytochrome [Vicinamibacterales bacterium]|nr:c-type cytochrome [Vicinamibacterales bacterium]